MKSSLIDSARATFRVSSGRASLPGPSTGIADQDGLGLARAILDSATNAAVVYDAEHDTFLANARAQELHGMPPASAPFDEWRAYHDVCWVDGTPVDPADLPLARARAGERVPGTRLVFRPRVGEARVVEVRAEPLLDAGRAVVGAIAIFRDVEGPESDAESERLRSAITARMTEGVTLVRAADGRIVYVNEAVERMFGYDPGEMVGLDVAVMNAPTDRSPSETAAEIAAGLERDGEWHGVVANVCKDGTRIWCLANVSAFEHSKHGRVWIAVQTNITERRRAEEALRIAEEHFRKIFEVGPLGIVMFSDDLTITDSNEACSRIIRYTRDQLIGRNIADVTHPEDAALDLEQVQRVIAGDAPSYRTEKRCLTGDGGTVWVSFTATMVRDDAGNPLYGLGIVEDIDERKRVESLMIRQNERLATGLESSLAELQLSRARILASADLERRRIERDLHDGAQQRLVALRVRLGLAQDLLQQDPVRGSALLKELGDDVDAALDEVRMLARGVYPSVLADRGIVEALRAAARNSPLSVSLRAAAVDRLSEELETAVYFTCVEALQNAAKHAQGETSVLISLSQGDSLHFEVRDDGVGFSPSGASAGAGLANMRDRIESVGGRLAIDSAPGEGTRVSGSIPLR